MGRVALVHRIVFLVKNFSRNFGSENNSVQKCRSEIRPYIFGDIAFGPGYRSLILKQLGIEMRLPSTESYQLLELL